MIKIIVSFIRGAFKVATPPIVPIIEAIKNIIHFFRGDATEPPHSWTSIVTQVILWGAVLYAFGTKIITLDQLIEYLSHSQIGG